MTSEDLLKIIGDKEAQIYDLRGQIVHLRSELEKATRVKPLSVVSPSAEQNRLKDGS